MTVLLFLFPLILEFVTGKRWKRWKPVSSQRLFHSPILHVSITQRPYGALPEKIQLGFLLSDVPTVMLYTNYSPSNTYIFDIQFHA